jgi:hypothetical protein
MTDIGQGLMCRIYLEIRKSSTDTDRPMVLASKDYKTIRSKLEKSFPEPLDYTKVILFNEYL